MNALSFKFGMLIVAVCMVASACSGNQGNTNSNSAATRTSANSTPASNNAQRPTEKVAYPQSVADEFMKSCQKAGSNAKFCRCLFDKIQDRYSLEEFSVIESKLIAGTPPEEFVEFTGKARAECTSR